jgi:hypothetical protein
MDKAGLFSRLQSDGNVYMYLHFLICILYICYYFVCYVELLVLKELETCLDFGVANRGVGSLQVFYESNALQLRRD